MDDFRIHKQIVSRNKNGREQISGQLPTKIIQDSNSAVRWLLEISQWFGGPNRKCQIIKAASKVSQKIWTLYLYLFPQC